MSVRKLNILILNWRDKEHPKAGGAEIVTMEHAKGWVKRGHNVTWLTSLYSNALIDEVIDGVHIRRRSGSLFIYIWAFFYTLFNGYKYDIIIDEIHGLPFLTPLATKTQKIAFIHEVASDIWNYMAPFPLNILGKLLEKIYFPLYKSIPFWSDAESTIDELVTFGINRSHCIAIPCPIKKDSRLTNFHIKEDNPTFIFVSRVVAMKGIEEIIKSFAFIVKELPDASLWIVGGGESKYIESLKKEIKELDLTEKVHFYGKVNEEEKISLMGKAHILLHASVKEGWGLVVLEAAYQGTPSVVYNVSGLKDVVKNNKTGIVLTNNSPRELAKQSINLYKDITRYKKYQIEGKRWVESITWEDVINQSESLLLKTANNI